VEGFGGSNIKSRNEVAKMPSVNRSDLEFAFEFSSSDGDFDNHAYVCRESGKIYWVSSENPLMDDAPEDLEESDQYVLVPTKRDFDLGVRLVMRFAGQEMATEYDDISKIFRRKGAYSRFKKFLERKGKLDAWYKYQQQETQEALEQWCESEGLTLTDEESS
jgi:hypothetical protein